MPELALSRRYATAFFHETAEAGTLDGVEKELRAIVARLGADPELAELLRSPQLMPHEKREVVDLTLAQDVSVPVQDFLHLLLDKGRVDHLTQIIDMFVALAERARGVLRGVVRTAVPLSAEERGALTARLGRATGKTVILEAAVDPALLGGVVVQLQNTLLDDSIRQRLIDLRHELLGGR